MKEVFKSVSKESSVDGEDLPHENQCVSGGSGVDGALLCREVTWNNREVARGTEKQNGW